MSIPGRWTVDMQSYKLKLATARAALGRGVTAVAVDQLFPTPTAVAERIITAARLEPGMRVLEPEAGTAAILRAILAANVPDLELVAVEIHEGLAAQLRGRFPAAQVIRGDFLSLRPDDIGPVDRILANPPFRNYQDIAHATHMLQFLKPRGIASVVMVDDNQLFRPELLGEEGHGRRAQRAQTFREAVEAHGRIMTIEKLPPGSFASQGTNVRTVLATIE